MAKKILIIGNSAKAYSLAKKLAEKHEIYITPSSDTLKEFAATLDIRENEVEFAIKPNNWDDMEEFFFDCLPGVNKFKLILLHAIIWLSLTTYAWEDYDSICGAFYNGIIKLNEVL